MKEISQIEFRRMSASELYQDPTPLIDYIAQHGERHALVPAVVANATNAKIPDMAEHALKDTTDAYKKFELKIFNVIKDSYLSLEGEESVTAQDEKEYHSRRLDAARYVSNFFKIELFSRNPELFVETLNVAMNKATGEKGAIMREELPDLMKMIKDAASEAGKFAEPHKREILRDTLIPVFKVIEESQDINSATHLPNIIEAANSLGMFRSKDVPRTNVSEIIKGPKGNNIHDALWARMGGDAYSHSVFTHVKGWDDDNPEHGLDPLVLNSAKIKYKVEGPHIYVHGEDNLEKLVEKGATFHGSNLYDKGGAAPNKK